MYSEVVGFWDLSKLRLQLKTSEIWTQAVYLWCFELQFGLWADAVCWITALKLWFFCVFECCRHIEYILYVFCALICCLLSLLRLQMIQQRNSGTQQSQQWQKTSCVCLSVCLSVCANKWYYYHYNTLITIHYRKSTALKTIKQIKQSLWQQLCKNDGGRWPICAEHWPTELKSPTAASNF